MFRDYTIITACVFMAVEVGTIELGIHVYLTMRMGYVAHAYLI